jgi:hypothetical protein
MKTENFILFNRRRRRSTAAPTNVIICQREASESIVGICFGGICKKREEQEEGD